MTTMISEVYDALKDAQGVSDEKARKAAEAIAQYDVRFTELKASIDALRANVDTKFAAQSGRINLLQWQLSVLIGGVVFWSSRHLFELCEVPAAPYWGASTDLAIKAIIHRDTAIAARRIVPRATPQ